MFSEIIKMIPTVDRAQLGSMFQSLNGRFADVAKKFGAGLKNVFKFGGVFALLGGLIAKLMNPLEKAEEVIDRILKKGDDAMTNAEEFGSDAGKLLRLEALAQTKGVDADTLRQMLGKFQSALAKEQEAAAAPARIAEQMKTEQDPQQLKVLEVQLVAAKAAAAQGGRLQEFVGETDMADAFFKFIQSLQRLDKSQQTVIQSEIFGEKVRGKAAEFLNAKDFAEILKQLPSTEVLREAAAKSGSVADLKDLLQAKRESEDFVKKSGLVNESQVQAIDQSERVKLRGEDETLKRFDSLKSSSIAIQELTHKFDGFVTDFITNVAPSLVNGVNVMSKFAAEFMPSFAEMKGAISTSLDLVVEGMADLVAGVEDLWTKGGEWVDGVAAKVSGAVKSIESVWAEFKSSRIYRTFGGGN